MTVNLQSDTATGIGGTFANVTNFVRQPRSDTSSAPTPASGRSRARRRLGRRLTFSSFENLTGGPATDTFAFQPGGSVSGNIDGGGGATPSIIRRSPRR